MKIRQETLWVVLDNYFGFTESKNSYQSSFLKAGLDVSLHEDMSHSIPRALL